MGVWEVTWRTGDGKLYIFNVSGPSGSTARHEAEKTGESRYGKGTIVKFEEK